ncbi:hypothetical protein [Bradyrhizobium oligotrophicum]|uniref:hypothetical protein n=1 Tax=Bradyrhizobium oligotrophicum TaxID=44255 RepID=UPI003EB90A4E
MTSPPRIWIDYRPVRIGWVATDRDIAQLVTAAAINSCLWGGRHNCIIPTHDIKLAKQLVTCFAVDILIPIKHSAEAQTFVESFPELQHDRWRKSIFQRRHCEFADIRHALRRIVANQDKQTETQIALPEWDSSDALDPLFHLQIGRYPTPNVDIPDYMSGVKNAFAVDDIQIGPTDALPPILLERIGPLALTTYNLTNANSYNGWRGPGVILGSIDNFDELTAFWNLRAAGMKLIFYDQNKGDRLRNFANEFLSRLRRPRIGPPRDVTFWTFRPVQSNENWKPDLDLSDLSYSLADGRGDTIWNGLNISPAAPRFSAWHQDVVPSYYEKGGKASASFSLTERPFRDDDIQALDQKFAVVVDATQYGERDAQFTFETPHIPKLNEFYGRHFYHDYDAARSEKGHFDKGAVAILTSISTQRLEVSAFHVFDWINAFFSLCGIHIQRSEAGLRCSRLISQLAGLQGCRVLKIRGVRRLLRKYGVDDHFTRAASIAAIRDVDPMTGTAGFDAFDRLFIEYREAERLTPDAVLKYLLERRVVRPGLVFTCPNCQLVSWIHLDDVKSRSTCDYCDHVYDVTNQLKDRDWRYRRSGIFGRDDDQLGGVPVALTLQQLGSTLHDSLAMYSTSLNFLPAGANIEKCESDFLGVVIGRTNGQSRVQIVIGESKTEGQFDESDVRKLRKLADAIPSDLAETFILFSKTGVFNETEVLLAKSLNSKRQARVILWTREELEPFYVYDRSKDRLGDQWHASTLDDMARITNSLFFK